MLNTLRRVVLVVFMLVVTTTGAFAMEGGGSHYMPGSRGDFAMALIGPPGWYLRNDLSLASGDMNALVIGDKVYASADQDVWVNNFKGIYLAASGLAGGRFGAVVSVPVVLDASLSADIAFPPRDRDGSKTGFADMNVTVFNNWKFGNISHNVGLTIFAPTGSYDSDRLINLGRNCWSFDFTLASTWLHPTRGHEISYTLGYMTNTENQDTDYQSGDEVHLDLHLGQHFSAAFAIGLEGYYYKQVSDDDGPLLDYANTLLPTLGANALGGNRAESYGAGPSVKYSFKMGDRDITTIAKWLHDFDAKKRFESDLIMVSCAFKF